MTGQLESFLVKFSYGGVGLVLLLAGFGLPIPEDIPLVIAGYMCGEGHASLAFMIPLCVAAVFGGDSILYFLGRRYGHHIPRLPLFRRYLTATRLAKAEGAFRQHGGKTLFAARFMPAVRAAIFFTAGTFKIPYSKMVIFDGGAALFSVPAWVLLGWLFHRQIDAVLGAIDNVKGVVGWIFGALILVIVAWYWMRRRKALARLQDRAAEPLAPDTGGDPGV